MLTFSFAKMPFQFAMNPLRAFFMIMMSRNIQGVSFNWSYPKNHKYGKKLKYQNWSYPKIHKYGKKLKYQNWSSPKIHKYQNWSPPQKTETRTIVFHSRENPGQQLIRCLTIWKTDCQLSCRL